MMMMMIMIKGKIKQRKKQKRSIRKVSETFKKMKKGIQIDGNINRCHQAKCDER